MSDLQKPAKGTAKKAKAKRRRERVTAEQKVMRAAKERDGHKCRNPMCHNSIPAFIPSWPIDAAHLKHRGAGGNPDGSRTERTAQIIALCRECHMAFDAGMLCIQPLGDGADGRCEFYRYLGET